MKNVGILIFNEVEVLDFAGPFEVFSIAEDSEGAKLFNAFLIAEKNDLVKARNNLIVQPNCTTSQSPPMDILIVPGGYGAEQIEIRNKPLLRWIRSQWNRTGLIASVCTGAFLLAEAGILTNELVTTHWMDQKGLQKRYPGLTVCKDEKYIDQGRIVTSGGISSGIEMSLYIVSKYFGKEAAERTAKRMEYTWTL